MFVHCHYSNEFISIKVRGNTWEPITRWLKFDSRIFKETTKKARITLCDIESLAEIYNYRSIRWKAKKLTPLPTKLIPKSLKNIFGEQPEKFRVIVEDIGGGFGVKAMTYPEDVVVIYASGKLQSNIR